MTHIRIIKISKEELGEGFPYDQVRTFRGEIAEDRFKKMKLF